MADRKAWLQELLDVMSQLQLLVRVKLCLLALLHTGMAASQHSMQI